MREYRSQEIVEKRQMLVSTTCNKCGDVDELGNDTPNKHMNQFSTSFGYGSKYDMESWAYDLCEDCLTDLIKSFKHVPDGFGEDSYCATYPQIMFEEWKETGVIDLEAGMSPEEIEANGGSIYSEEE